jgi:hypothetical protein
MQIESGLTGTHLKGGPPRRMIRLKVTTQCSGVLKELPLTQCKFGIKCQGSEAILGGVNQMRNFLSQKMWFRIVLVCFGIHFLASADDQTRIPATIATSQSAVKRAELTIGRLSNSDELFAETLANLEAVDDSTTIPFSSFTSSDSVWVLSATNIPLFRSIRGQGDTTVHQRNLKVILEARTGKLLKVTSVLRVYCSPLVRRCS